MYKDQLYAQINTIEKKINDLEISKKLLLILSCLGLITYLIYDMMFIEANQQFKQNASQLKSFKVRVTTSKNNLESQRNAIITVFKQTEARNNQIKQQIQTLKEKQLLISKFMMKLKTLKVDAFFQKNFLNRIAYLVEKNNVQFENLKNISINKDLDKPFKKVFKINFKATGRFTNIVNLLRDIESENYITEINNLKIFRKNDNLIIECMLVLWGVS